jgi:hypothetical protein
MHYWGSPLYKDNILRFFVILDHEKKIIENNEIKYQAMFFISVVVAKNEKVPNGEEKDTRKYTSKDEAKYCKVLRGTKFQVSPVKRDMPDSSSR